MEEEFRGFGFGDAGRSGGEEKKARGKKMKQTKKADPRKLEILDACYALGRVCSFFGDFDDTRRYY